MNMSTWAIRKPVPSLALFLVLVIAGLVGFMRLPVTQFPNIDIPIISITIAQPGAAPSEIANQIVKPVESAVSDVTGVNHVSATATDGLASIIIEFDLEVDSDRALNEIKDALAGVRGDLPDSITEPNVQRVDVIGAPILTYAVSDPTQSIEDLSYFVDEVVARDLTGASGIGKVTRIGGGDQAIEVELNPDRLLALGLTASDVNGQLRQNNIDLGGGSGDLAGQEFSIRALGSAPTIADLAATRISLSGGGSVRLDDLGTVRDGAQDAASFAMYNGQPVVAFGVFRATGASDLTAGDNAKGRIAALSSSYPNAEFALIDDATRYTESTYHAAMETLFEGAALAIIVVFLFLKNWRATLITAVALPLSIIPTFIVMNYLGFSLNTVSLLGITLVTGILVDDAIVEIENIVRHVHMGKPAYEASEEASTEIGTTVIAISFTIVAVFAPVSFMSGIAGQYFKQFGLTVAVAVLFSLLVARLITPMMAAYFLRDGTAAEEEKDGALMRGYLRILGWTLRNRFVTLMLGVVIFVVSIFSATLLPTEFIPASDTGRASVSVELPPGSLMEQTRGVARDVTQIIRTIPEVQTVFVDGSDTKATVRIGFGPKTERERSSFEISDQLGVLLAGVPDVRLFVLSEDGKRDLTISVLGDDVARTAAAAQTLAEQMNGLPQVEGASSQASLVRPEIQITPRPELAAQMGVTSAALASTTRIATIGDTGGNVAKFNTGERQIPIIVRLEQDVREDLLRMAGIRIPSSTGAPVPLSVVADVALSTGPTAIDRYDRQYRTTVEADVAKGYFLGQAAEAVNGLPIALAMPEGTAVQAGGDAEVMGEIFAQFGLAMGAGILLVYVVLVLLFASFMTPVTILMSLPLAIGGAIFALYIYGSGIGLSVVIGFLMLMGIVTKNAIMLVEFALEEMKTGTPKAAAMLEAGHKRARPIIMTTIAMTAGMVPSALAVAEGGEFRAPMAVAVIGGLLLSTVLSLLFVPSLFSVVEGGRTRARRAMVGVLGANQPRET
ncbi:hydrophobe/amphiphile efflux-1 (HAE1) family protein [Pseudorhodobacter antarcticus]|uniref:Hydrophobe/amphiphile efflux-1 (HAE1) family protein n=1 Tax=Pseudorhodobacter antarcticus TaxID=1077947 RepID=A0A1H8IX86_9RHOB|nr:efflux RND transporter permease subunit [Pseudorhodobacter antarcticus]SEN72765.1 hydrophobe/amphiphile efflux-1 (HAE1) family protein [Pseudorhodobacter antarcticus]